MEYFSIETGKMEFPPGSGRKLNYIKPLYNEINADNKGEIMLEVDTFLRDGGTDGNEIVFDMSGSRSKAAVYGMNLILGVNRVSGHSNKCTHFIIGSGDKANKFIRDSYLDTVMNIYEKNESGNLTTL